MITTKPSLVSVVMIFLNEERFIDEAIRSVLAQDYTELELILVDDGSSDTSTAIARSYARQHPGRVRYVEHEGHVNRGMSASRNLGFRLANGEFVAFGDADDVWHSCRLTEQVEIMRQHPNLGMVCGSARYWRSWMGEDDTIVLTGHVQNQVVEPPEASLKLYPLGSAAAPCDMLLRRHTVEAVGGFEERFTGMYEDQAFLAKLYLTAPVYFSDRLWFDYRQHEASCVAQSIRAGSYDEVRRTFLDWFEQYLDNNAVLADPSVRRALNRALRPYRRPLWHTVVTQTARLPRIPSRIGQAYQGAIGRLRSSQPRSTS